MILSTLLSAWIMGSVGSAHCVVMCGGAASTLSGTVVQIGRRPRVSPVTLSLGFNAGRIGSYALAGMVAGTIGVAIDHVPFVLGAQIALRLLAGLLLCAVGLYITGIWKRGVAFERVGLPLWRRIQPLVARLLPVRSLGAALGLGALWGWMPCGLVYAALGVALASGSPIVGGLTMIAFGVGTLPALLVMGVFGKQLGALAHHAMVRRVAGVTILLFGLFHVVAAGAQVGASPQNAHACCKVHHAGS